MLLFFISSNVVNALLIKCLYAGLFFIVFQMARNASHKPGVYICTNIDKSLGERLGKGQSSRQKFKSSCASVSVHVFGVPRARLAHVSIWMRVRTNLQRGGQYAEAVQALVEMRVSGPSEKWLPELWLTFGLRPPTQRTDPTLLACTKQVAQRGTFTATFRAVRGETETRTFNVEFASHLLQD